MPLSWEDILTGFYARINRWVETTVWGPVDPQKPWWTRWGQAFLRWQFILWQKFNDDLVPLRASALTYTTLLAIVPCFALIFSVLKGLGAHETLEPLIVERVAAGSAELVHQILSYIENTNLKTLGCLGVGGLVITVVATLSTIEAAFNVIWSVKSLRYWFRRWMDYLSVVILAPLFLLAAITVTASLQVRAVAAVESLEKWGVLGHWITYGLGRFPTMSHLAPYVIVWALFSFLYFFLPNTRIRLDSAIIGGLFGGTLWQMAQWWYIHFQSNLAQANAIYGAMAQLPLLLGWIYLSWVVVLLGAEATFAHQHLHRYSPKRLRSQGAEAREGAVLAAMAAIGRRFRGGESPWTATLLAEHLRLPDTLVTDLLEMLVKEKILVASDEDPPTYLPAKDLSKIYAWEILAVVDGPGKLFPAWDASLPEIAIVNNLLERKHAALQQAIHTLTLEELLTSPK